MRATQQYVCFLVYFLACHRTSVSAHESSLLLATQKLAASSKIQRERARNNNERTFRKKGYKHKALMHCLLYRYTKHTYMYMFIYMCVCVHVLAADQQRMQSNINNSLQCVKVP